MKFWLPIISCVGNFAEQSGLNAALAVEMERKIAVYDVNDRPSATWKLQQMTWLDAVQRRTQCTSWVVFLDELSPGRRARMFSSLCSCACAASSSSHYRRLTDRGKSEWLGMPHELMTSSAVTRDSGDEKMARRTNNNGPVSSSSSVGPSRWLAAPCLYRDRSLCEVCVDLAGSVRRPVRNSVNKAVNGFASSRFTLRNRPYLYYLERRTKIPYSPVAFVLPVFSTMSAVV